MTISEGFSQTQLETDTAGGARSPTRQHVAGEERTSLVRYVLFNSVIVFVFAYAAVFLGAVEFLWAHDATRFSFLIIGIYALITIYIGLARDNVNDEVVYFAGNRLTSLGLVGTVIGIMLLMHDIGSSNIEQVGQVFALLVKGMSTLLITTLCGMAFSLLVDLQMWVVLGRQNK